MIRPPPRSPFFPYPPPSHTTLPHLPLPPARQLDRRQRLRRQRSEEHTSELQSQSNLVCRLLLEKKKNVVRGEHERRLSHIIFSVTSEMLVLNLWNANAMDAG